MALPANVQTPPPTTTRPAAAPDPRRAQYLEVRGAVHRKLLTRLNLEKLATSERAPRSGVVLERQPDGLGPRCDPRLLQIRPHCRGRAVLPSSTMRRLMRSLCVSLVVVLLIARSSVSAQSPRPTDTQTISRGWTALAAGRLTEAVSAADSVLKRKPRSHAAFTLDGLT